jgi:5-methylcytosine-specific restriction enzyme A
MMDAPSEAAYLLTWNPKRWSWDDLEEDANATEEGRLVEMLWSCGRTKHIEPGSRVFLLRQGLDPRGIIGSGIALSEPELHEHWDVERAEQGNQALFINVGFERLLNPEKGDEPLRLAVLQRDELSETNWNTQSSGIRIKSGIEELERLWKEHLRRIRRAEEGMAESAMEGALSFAFKRHRARESWLRNAKIQEAKQSNNGRLKCEVLRCGFDFLEFYGEIGRDFAHVHHKKPLSDRTLPSETRLSDLAIVCANCHAMIHQGGECRPLDDLVPTRR